MTPDIDRLRELNERAGEWYTVTEKGTVDICTRKARRPAVVALMVSPEDAECIIAEHEAVPGLCDEVERLREEIEHGDYWRERARNALEGGTCPICFGKDEEGHKPTCMWGRDEATVEKAQKALGAAGMVAYRLGDGCPREIYWEEYRSPACKDACEKRHSQESVVACWVEYFTRAALGVSE